jgi:sortase A
MRLRINQPAADYRTMGRYALLTVAVVCLGIYSCAYLEQVFYQTYESWKFDQAQAPVAGVIAPSSGTIIPIARTQRWSRNSMASPRRPSSAALIGRLSVPRLKLSAMVREGIDQNTLLMAVGHIPATALPGQPGNVGVAGHRDTFFRGLKDLRAQDEIQLSTLGGEFKYVVESLMIVEPDNVGVLAQTSESVLTLVTCYPFSFIGTAPKRFIVRARQVLPSTVPAPAVE